MAEWVTQKKEFYKIAIAQGFAHPDQIDRAFPLGHSIPKEKIDRWLIQLLETPKSLCSQRRYINRFMIGADPEFIFVDSRKHPDIPGQVIDTRMDARDLKFHQGLAFGADNNGRLTEIRPAPARSAVDVCASIWATLRWMTTLYPVTLKLKWLCGAFLYEDGLGGHVHFGRKRPQRNEEITALDAIETAVEVLGLFPAGEIRARRAGDARHQLYGRLGDFRIQRHGYEYRTWPSWMDSPALGFLILTLSKLAVHDPGMLMSQVAKNSNVQQRVRNFLSYYKNLDDDARLALILIDRTWPRHIGGDFKGRWGFGTEGFTNKKVQIIPTSITPTTNECYQMFRHILEGRPLVVTDDTPTWNPIAPPTGYEMCIWKSTTIGYKGMGELIWNICCSKTLPIAVGCREHGQYSPLGVSGDLARYIPREVFEDEYVYRFNSPAQFVSLSDRARENYTEATVLKHNLLSGWLPLWDVRKVTPESYDKWKTMVSRLDTIASLRTRFVGKVLYSTQDKFGIQGGS